ncbi:MAG TPA: DNA double-strand break repair nuclease NurA [Armatimonadetes bacterium]|nr:DNA double-strand break repair nuclease NurA [Armatimonadota bacterium]
MLDWTEVQQQIQRMAQEQVQVTAEREDKLSLALERVARYGEEGWLALAAKIAGSRTSWLVAELTAPLTTRVSAPPCPRPLSVLAADGSQIFPDRHESVPCYLLNIGRVALHYGQEQRPLLDSRAYLGYREQDVYQFWGGQRILVTPEVVAARRKVREFEALADLAEKQNTGAPRVALTDGSLIMWGLESKPSDFQQEVLHSLLRALSRLRKQRVPVVGYISRPASADVIYALRVGDCDQERANCDRCPHLPARMRNGRPVQLTLSRYALEVLPCATVEGLTDEMLFGAYLEPGERTAVFHSQSRILQHYGEHAVDFFYLQVGTEVTRLEVPRWVSEERTLLELVHAAVLDQVEKGGGYPVALTEAHEQAVLRTADREMFLHLLERAFVGRGLAAPLSPKGLSKRRPRI